MRSPITALTWEIWRPNRRFAIVAVAALLFAWLFNLALPDSYHSTKVGREWLMTINGLLAAASFLFVFAMFNHTEFNPQREWNGFPYRLFALPVPTWLLVALPMALGVAAVEVLYLAWARLVFRDAEPGLLPWL